MHSTGITPDVALGILILPAIALVWWVIYAMVASLHGHSVFDRARTVRVMSATEVIVTRTPMMSRKVLIHRYIEDPHGWRWYRMPDATEAEWAIFQHIERSVAQWKIREGIA